MKSALGLASVDAPPSFLIAAHASRRREVKFMLFSTMKQNLLRVAYSFGVSRLNPRAKPTPPTSAPNPTANDCGSQAACWM